MKKAWKLRRVVQCTACPWRVATNPHEIPHGYDVEKHRALAATIAEPGAWHPATPQPLKVFACHELEEAHCIGWLVQQLGEGNNIPLRIQMMTCTNGTHIRLRGAQHATFADTLPREEAPAKPQEGP